MLSVSTSVDISPLVSMEINRLRNRDLWKLFGSSSHKQAGNHELLGLVLYEPGSDWDIQVQTKRAVGEDVYLEEDGSALSLVTPISISNRTLGTTRSSRVASQIADS